MDTTSHRRIRRRRLASPLLAAALVLLGAGPAAATWSIVGVDPETGEVGVAVASCVSFNPVSVPVLVPGKGAAASQAAINEESGDPIAAALADGARAQEVIAMLTSPEFDPAAETRQYGVVTLSGTAAGHTGQDNDEVALDRQDSRATASVQGNILASADVVTAALETFESTEGTLADRLLAALAAGPGPGGDSRCDQETANSAALLVARPGDPTWSATDIHVDSDVSKLATPSVYVSIITHKSNPIPALQQAYVNNLATDGTVAYSQGTSSLFATVSYFLIGAAASP